LTLYHIVGPSAELETMMDLESDRFKGLKYDEEAFRTESLAVLGEYNKGVSNPVQPMFAHADRDRRPIPQSARHSKLPRTGFA
jgi:predicted Zn-dependent peptidase